MFGWGCCVGAVGRRPRQVLRGWVRRKAGGAEGVGKPGVSSDLDVGWPERGIRGRSRRGAAEVPRPPPACLPGKRFRRAQAMNVAMAGQLGTGVAGARPTSPSVQAGNVGPAGAPAPGENGVTGNMVGGDPFAASVALAPPAYLQMSDMERKQRLLMEEQNAWEQYVRISGDAAVERGAGEAGEGEAGTEVLRER